ncbi:MAG: ABC transporter ATP-binding protein [Bacteroidetes bacterium]|nr:ABC transporter ATP-binding protein [Bacteroidota bacterium]
MRRFLQLLRYLIPYKWLVGQNVIYNILGAFFGLFSFAMVVPFLRVLFEIQELVNDPIPFQLNVDYLMHMLNYYMSMIMAKHGEGGALMMVSILVVIFSLMKNGFLFGANFVLAPIRAFVVRDMRNDIYGKVITLPLSFYSEARKGDVLARISNDVQEVETSVISSLQMLFRDPITIVIYLIFLFSISFQLTIIVLVLLPVSGLLIGRIARKLRRTTFKGQQKLGILLAQVEETLSGLRIIKAFNGEERMTSKFMETNQHFALLFRKVFRRRYLASPISEFLGTIVMMLILTYGGYMVIKGGAGLDGENLIFFLIIFSQIITPAKAFSSAWFNIQKGLASVDRIDQLLDADIKIEEKEDALQVDQFKESVEYRNVSFKYDKEYVLKDVSFTIRKGETIALVGKSGSGKSTLVDLLPRFMDVEQGEILIDGIPLTDYALKPVRSLMGIVSQQSILFNDSFRNNIAFGISRQPGEDEIINAAKVANAHEFIIENEEGYEAGVGDGGSKLSGGQKQRVSIARAVMANPPILILDEATSALDTESERLVQEAIINLMKSRTSIVIAHRLSTIKHADQILVMDEGKIVERGTHDELMKKPTGVYYKLHKMQMT